MEGESYSTTITGAGIDLFSLDFSGCGNSEGEFVTLGHKETDDLLSVINYLAEQGKTSKVGFWGRSMGAATSMMFDAQKMPAGITIGGMVVDSGFSSLDKVVSGIAATQGLPP